MKSPSPAVRAGIALNAALAVFSAIWLAGHSTVRMFDWEFWFALLFLIAALVNLLLFRHLGRGTPHEPPL